MDPTPFNNQNYADIKRYLQRTGQRFVDPMFPPDDTSLVYPQNSRIKCDGVIWKRPRDLCKNPKMIVDGVSANDLNQGKLANCWYVASCSALTQKEEVWRKVIPDVQEQDYDENNLDAHCGIFHFRFWHYGEWIDVVIDDYLPVKHDKLYFVHSRSKNEFWSPLLEKAYAKVFGCYEALHLGSVTEALEDFTGGVAESVDLEEGQFSELPDKRKELFTMMKERMEKGALLGAFITPKSAAGFEQITPEGLYMGHAYGITGITIVDTTSLAGGQQLYFVFSPQKMDMVRLRNPWGFGEWKGRFSDSSKEWKSIDLESKKRIGLVFEEDGEFWMLMEDFCKYYNQMSFCHRVEGMQGTVISSEWDSECAGGGDDKDTFLINPQVVFEVTNDSSEVLIGLTVKTGQEQGDLKRHKLGIFVYRVECNRKYRTKIKGRQCLSKKQRLSFTVGVRCNLTEGRYLIVPCTKRPGVRREFIVRVFTQKPNKARLLPELPHVDEVIYKMITKLTVISGKGLTNKLTKGVKGENTGYTLYIYAYCENEEGQSHVVKDTTDPVWNAEFIFYRKKPLKFPIVLEVWDDMMFLGRHKMIAAEKWKDEEFQLNLLDKNKVAVPGTIHVKITNTSNMDAH